VGWLGVWRRSRGPGRFAGRRWGTGWAAGRSRWPNAFDREFNLGLPVKDGVSTIGVITANVDFLSFDSSYVRAELQFDVITDANSRGQTA